MGPLLFLLNISELFSILENKLIGYANDSTFMDVVPSLSVRVTVAESLIRDLCTISEWCDLWGMKLNYRKTNSLQVRQNGSPDTPINDWQNSADVDILGVTTDSKITFEKHLCSGSRAASQRLGFMRKS